MPLSAWVLAHSLLTDFLRKFWTKPIYPKPYSFVTDIDAAFMQDVFDLTKTQWISYVIHHYQSDDFRWSLEIFEGRTCCHSKKLGTNQWDVKFVWQYPNDYFKTSPKVIRLAVIMYVEFPLSLRNVEDLLHDRSVDVSLTQAATAARRNWHCR